MALNNLDYVYGSTELAAETDTQNIRSRKKTPKGTLFQRQKDPYYLQSMWEAKHVEIKCQMVLNYVD